MRDVCFERYNNRVRYITEKTLRDHNIHLDNRFDNNIDHLFPIRKGYELGIPETLIASIDNLQILDRKSNRQKGSTITEVPPHILEWCIDNDVYWK